MVFGSGVTGGLGTGIVFALHDQFSATADKISAKFDKLNGLSDVAVQRFNAAQNGMRKGFTSMMVAAGILAPLIFALNTTAKLDDQMADVAKTTGMARTEVVGLKRDLYNINTRTSISDLLGIATIGGQIGIAKDQIYDFTQAVDKVTVALGDEFKGGAEEVSSTLGKLRNVMTDIKSIKVDQDLLHIGNALNVLGAAGFATGPVVADFASRIGGIGIPLGLTSSQVLGLSASLQELNVDVERGGSAVGRALQRMLTNTGAFARIAGMDVKGFESMLNTDLYGAFIKVIEGSKKYGNNSVELAKILDDLKLDGIGTAEVFLKLGSYLDEKTGLPSKVKLANEALKNTDSIMNEFNLKNNNLPALFDKASKKMKQFADIIGIAVSPVFTPLINLFILFVDVLQKVIENPIGRVFLQIVAAGGVLLGVFGLVVFAMNAMKFASAKAAIALGELGYAELANIFHEKGMIAGLKEMIVSTYASIKAKISSMIATNRQTVSTWTFSNSVRANTANVQTNALALRGSSGSLQVYTAGTGVATVGTNSLTGAFARGRAASSAFMASIGPIGWALIAISSIYILLSSSVSKFNKVMDGSAKPANGFLGFMQRVGGVLAGIGEIFGSASKEGFKMSSKLHDALEKLGILQFVINLGTWIVRLKGFFYGIWNGIKSVFSELKGALSFTATLFDNLFGSVNKSTSSVKDWWKNGKILGQVIGGMLIGLIVILTVAMFNLAVSVIAATWPFLAAIAAILGVIWVIKHWGDISDWVVKKFESIGDSIAGFFSGVGDWFSGIGDKLFEIGASFIDWILDGIKSKWSELMNWFSGIGDSIAGFFGQMFGIDNTMTVNHSMAGGGGVDIPTNRNNIGITETGRLIAQEKYIENNRETQQNTIEKHYHTEKVESVQLVMPDGRILADTVNRHNDKQNFRKNGRG